MNKKLTSVLALALCLIMVVGVFAACGPKEPEVVPATFKQAEYNTTTSVMPSNWNEFTYADNNDTQIMNYIGSAFFEYDYKFVDDKKYNADVFVCGDYNASESTSEYKSFIEKSGFVDAKKSAQTIKLACKTYHTLFQSVSTGTYESIDHITFSKETQPKVLFYNTLIHDYVIDASDHCPIYIDVKLSK